MHITWALWEKELGQRANARLLLQRGHEFNRSDPVLLQAWAIMEEEDGHITLARDLFQRASQADPHHVPVWQVRAFQQAHRAPCPRAMATPACTRTT